MKVVFGLLIVVVFVAAFAVSVTLWVIGFFAFLRLREINEMQKEFEPTGLLCPIHGEYDTICQHCCGPVGDRDAWEKVKPIKPQKERTHVTES